MDEDQTSFAVVDGQQRIRTLLQFVGVEIDPKEVQHNNFPLDELDDDSRWIGIRYEDLTLDDRRNFLLYRFGVRYLNTEDDRLVRNIFERLNAFTTPLSPQEVRNARYTGAFITLITRLADDEYWVENRITTPTMIRRMKDIEFVSELVVGTLNGPQKGSPGAINEFYEQYGNYDDEFPDQRRAEQLFRKTLATIQAVIPNIRETRWQNRTDFYTLFVCIASLFYDMQITPTHFKNLREALITFGDDIDKARRGEVKNPPKHVKLYLNAVEKGANDKARRADRHEALLAVIEKFFAPKRATDR